MQGWRYQLEEDFGKKCPRWVVTRDFAWRCEHDGCNIAVFKRTLLSILHSPIERKSLFGRKNRLVQPDSLNVGRTVRVFKISIPPQKGKENHQVNPVDAGGKFLEDGHDLACSMPRQQKKIVPLVPPVLCLVMPAHTNPMWRAQPILMNKIRIRARGCLAAMLTLPGIAWCADEISAE